ncbi:unnamed protein product [Caenorhabditis nigoni]
MESQKKREEPIQVNDVSSSNDSWRNDLKNETAKVRSLYPKPFADPLNLQVILEGNEANENNESERMMLMRKKTKRSQKPVMKRAMKVNSRIETTIPENKLCSLYPKPYGDPLGLRMILGQEEWF